MFIFLFHGGAACVQRVVSCRLFLGPHQCNRNENLKGQLDSLFTTEYLAFGISSLFEQQFFYFLWVKSACIYPVRRTHVLLSPRLQQAATKISSVADGLGGGSLEQAFGLYFGHMKISRQYTGQIVALNARFVTRNIQVSNSVESVKTKQFGMFTRFTNDLAPGCVLRS